MMVILANTYKTKKNISRLRPDIDIIYDIDGYPPFGFVKKYLDEYNIEIKNIILDKDDNVSCVYTEGGMIPVGSEKVKGISNYDTIIKFNHLKLINIS